LAFGVYAVKKERHLQRLARLYHDECSIHLTVADSLLRSGVLRDDQEVLNLRTAVELGASRLAADLVERGTTAFDLRMFAPERFAA